MSFFPGARLAVVVFVGFVSWVMVPAAAATDSFAPLSVELTVSETAGLARTQEPVTLGVPLPRSANIADAASLRVVAADGATPVPAQIQVTARWDGPPADTTKPIRWALIDFQADVAANGSATYYLKDGGGSAPSGIIVTTTASQITVATGAVTVTLSRTSFNLFDTVDLGLGPIVSSPIDGLTLTGAAGAFSAWKVAATDVSVETAGPLHTVIHARGRLSTGSATLTGGDAAALYGGSAQGQELEYRFRLHFFAGKGTVRVEQTLINDGNGLNGSGPNNSLYVKSLVLGTTLNLGAAQTAVVDGVTSTGTSADQYRLSQSHSVVNATDETANFSYSITKNGGAIGSGARARGFVDLSDANQGLTVALRYFWQSYPKALRAGGNQIAADLLPDTGTNYVQRGGQYLTHELIYSFHPGGFAAAGGDAAVTAFQNPLAARANPTWYADTQGLGLIGPSGLTSTDPDRQEAFNRFEQQQRVKINAAEASNLKSILTYREHRELAGDWYGWNDFGDMRWRYPTGSLFSGIQYDWPYSLLLHYLRTGNRAFMDLGLEMVRHQADFDIHHGVAAGQAAWVKGMAFFEDNGHYATATNFVGLVEQNQGYCLAYLMTGTARYLETCKLAADEGWTHWTTYMSTAPAYIRSEQRIYGWIILRLLAYYKISGDVAYLNNAMTVFTDGLLANEQSPPPPTNIGSNGQGYVYDDVGTGDCSTSGNYRVRVLMLGYVVDPVVELHRLTQSTVVSDYLLRMLNFVRTQVYVGGVTNGSGNYLPYQTPYCYNPATGAREFRDIQVIYNYFFAGGYAYLYALTRDPAQLTFARSVFRDAEFYWESTSNTYINPASRTPLYLGYEPQTSKQQGWIGRFHQVYLATEYQLQINNDLLPSWFPLDPPLPVPDTTPPSSPANLQASVLQATRVDLSWDASTDTGGSGLAGYRIERCSGLGCTGFVEIGTTAATAYADATVQPGMNYGYQVRAYDSADNVSIPSAPVDVRTPTLIISGISVASVTITDATITWSTNESADSQVEYGLTTAYGQSSALDPALVTSHSVTLAGLAPGTAYHFRVWSQSAGGDRVTSDDAVLRTELGAAVLKGVQSGSVTLAAGAAAVTVALATVDTSRAFLVFGTRFNDANPGFSQISGRISAATGVTFERAESSGAPAVTITWYVAEFTAGVRVQRGSVTLPNVSGANVTLPVSINPVRAFPIVSYRKSGTLYDSNDFVRARLPAPETLELATGSAGMGTVEWQVVEYGSANVQAGDVAFGAADGVRSAVLPQPVNPAKSWLIYSYRTDTGALGIGDKLVAGGVTDGATLTFQRDQTGPILDLAWFLVEFTDLATVQQGSAALAAAAASVDVALAPAASGAQSFAAGGYLMKGGRSAYNADDNPGIGWMTFELVSPTTLRIARGATGAAAAIGWSVVNFGPDTTPPAAPTALAAADVPNDAGGALSLSWTVSASSDVVEQRLYRGVVSGSHPDLVFVTPDNATHGYTDTGLVNNTTYFYVVRAFDGTQESTDSNEASATPHDNLAPVISGLAASGVTNSGATITWSTNEPADGQVEYGTTTAYGSASALAPALVTAHNIALTGLAPATLYHYRVKSRDAAGNLATSGDATFTTSAPVTTRSVQTGSVTFAAGAASVTVTIAAVTPGQAFLVFGTSFNDANPGFSQVSGQITSATALTFQRATAAGSPAVTIRWYVAEFSAGVAVQRGSIAFSGATLANVALTAVDLTKAFVLVSYRNSGPLYDGDDFVRAKLTTATNLELSSTTAPAAGVVEWQVVESAGARVQRGDVAFVATDAAKTAPITAVNTAKAWLIYSYRSDNGVVGIGQKLVRGQVGGATSLTFDRSVTGQALNLTWQLVEFTDATTVQSGTINLAAAKTFVTAKITPINTAKTIAAGGYLARGGRSTYTADDNPGVGWMTFDFQNSGMLRATRGNSAAAADVGWFVVQFP